MSINRVVISGNLTRDGDSRTTPSGTSVLSFGVAVNDRRKNQQTGAWEDYPNYIDCTMFGTRAAALSNYLKKGTKVAIEGHLQWRQWEKDGQKRSKIDVIVDEIEFMSSRDNAGSSAAMAGGGMSNGSYAGMPAPERSYGNVPPASERSYGNIPPAPVADAYPDEDIPF